MRQNEYRPPLAVSVKLIIVIGIAFFVQLIVGLGGPSGEGAFYRFLALNPETPLFWPWQLITFQFLHFPGGGFLHVIFNCLGIYFLGKPIEARLGSVKFLQLYFASGVMGGLMQLILTYSFSSHFGGGFTLGASAGVFGLLAAFALLNWETQITMLLFLVIPVTMRAKYLLILGGIMTIAGLLRPEQVAHGAHLGGMLAGILFVKYVAFNSVKIDWSRLTGSKSSSSKVVPMPRRKLRRGVKSSPIVPLSTDEFIRSKVDPILEKISAHGIQSLTEEERSILEKARSQMGK